MTALTQHEKDLIRGSFQRIAPNAEQIVALFYKTLFANVPNLRPLFDTVNIRDQQVKMMRTLMASVAFLDDPDTLDREMRALGQRHLAYGVVNSHYDEVGKALIATLRNNPAAALTDEEADAWQKLYNIMADAARSETQLG